MGRPLANIDTEKLLEEMDNQIPQKEIAKNLGVSIPTLRNRIDDIRATQGIILETKEVENLRVIKIKGDVLTRIENQLHTMEADDLLKALNVLNKMDKPDDEGGKMKGLLGLLSAIDGEAEKRADEKVEERMLEEKTIETTSNIPQL